MTPREAPRSGPFREVPPDSEDGKPLRTRAEATASAPPRLPTAESAATLRFVVAFQEAYWADLDQGTAPELRRYLERTPPEHHAAVLAEFLELEGVAHLVSTASADPRTERVPSAERTGSSAPGTEAVAPDGVIAHYRVLSLLGRGGQGTVYLALDTKLDRKVALKVLDRSLTPSGDAVERFRREAAIAAKLDHPSLCAVFDAGIDRGRAWLAMRYVPGETLAARISRARREQPDAPPIAMPSHPGDDPRSRVRAVAALGAKVARALHAAHAAGIVHRDIKPGNIMLGDDQLPVVLDFGLARDVAGDGFLTRSGDIFGTPAYMAPEQLEETASPPPDARTDVFALGVTLFEALTLERPFGGPTVAATIRSILDDEPRRAELIVPAVDADLAAILGKALERERARRYPSAEAFAVDLEAWSEGRPVSARPPGPLGRLARRVRRKPARAALMAVTAVGLPLLAGLGTWVISTRDEVELARRTTLENDLEEQLAQGFLWLRENRLELARECFERARGLHSSSEEALIGRALVAAAAGGPKAGLTVLSDQVVEGVEGRASARLRAQWLHATGDAEAAAVIEAGLGPPVSADEFFVAASAARDSATSDPAAIARAADLALEAVYRSRSARVSYVLQALSLAARAGQPELAHSLRDAALALGPRSPSVLATVALLALKDNDAAGAQQYAERLLAIDPSHRVARASLGYARYLGGAKAEAMEIFEDATRRDPTDALAWCGLAEVAIDRQDFPKALAAAEQAARRGAERPHAERLAGIALVGLQRFADARTRLEAALEADRSPATALRVLPYLAFVHATLGNPAAAEASLAEEGRARATPASPLAGTVDSSWSLMLRAVTLARLGRHADAARMLEEGLHRSPDDPELHHNLGVVLGELGRHEAAVEHLRRATAIDFERPNSWWELVRALERAGSREDAMLAAEEARRRKVAGPELLFRLGLRYEEAYRDEEALDAYRATIEKSPEFAEAWCNLGRGLERRGRFEEGLAALRRGHELGSARRNWNYDSARWVAEAERRVKDARRIEAVVAGKELPADSAEWLSLAGVAAQGGRTSQVLALLEGAARSSPGPLPRARPIEILVRTLARAPLGSDDAARASSEALAQLRALVAEAEDDVRGAVRTARGLRELPEFAPLRKETLPAWIPAVDAPSWRDLLAALEGL